MNVIDILDIFIIVLIGCIFLLSILLVVILKTPDVSQLKVYSTYDDIKNSLKTLDIIGFCGSPLDHFFVRAYVSSPISHIGMVFRDVDKRLPSTTDSNDLYVFESTNNSKIDVLVGLPNRAAPVLTPLHEKLSTYSNHRFVLIRLLNTDIHNDNIKNDAVLNYIRRANTRPFNGNVMTWVRAVLYKEKPAYEHGLFCSHLIAQLYQELGIIGNREFPFCILPSRFYTRDLEMCKGYFFGEPLCFTCV